MNTIKENARLAKGVPVQGGLAGAIDGQQDKRKRTTSRRWHKHLKHVERRFHGEHWTDEAKTFEEYQAHYRRITAGKVVS